MCAMLSDLCGFGCVVVVVVVVVVEKATRNMPTAVYVSRPL